MATMFREQIKTMTKRDFITMQRELATMREKDRTLQSRLKQTETLLQGVTNQALTRTPIEWSLSGVDAETQTDEVLSYREEDHSGLSEVSMISPVYETLEAVMMEIANKGINSVFLSDWVVSLLAIIRRLNPMCLAFPSYYYENEARFHVSPLDMLRLKSGVCFMSSLDSMCKYSSGSTERDLYPDSEILVHYSVAYVSGLSMDGPSYTEFCEDPLAYSTKQLAIAVDTTIMDIVQFIRTPPSDGECTLSKNWFPPSYVQVVNAVNAIIQSGNHAVKNSVLIQFLPLSKSGGQRKTDMTHKEKFFLGLVIRTALMWHMTYRLSSTVQVDSLHACHDLLSRCIATDPIVMQSLYNASKGPYLSTGMLVPGLFAYLFYISREPGALVKIASHATNMPLASNHTTILDADLKKWCTEDFGVRSKMANFIAGDSVMKAGMATTRPAFGGTPKNILQEQIDSALISFLRDILIHEQLYKEASEVAIKHLKEVTSSREYLQTSQITRAREYCLGHTTKPFRAMTGFLKNPFLYKLQHTKNFDVQGRLAVQTSRDTMVCTSVVSTT